MLIVSLSVYVKRSREGSGINSVNMRITPEFTIALQTSPFCVSYYISRDSVAISKSFNYITYSRLFLPIGFGEKSLQGNVFVTPN